MAGPPAGAAGGARVPPPRGDDALTARRAGSVDARSSRRPRGAGAAKIVATLPRPLPDLEPNWGTLARLQRTM